MELFFCDTGVELYCPSTDEVILGEDGLNEDASALIAYWCDLVAQEPVIKDDTLNKEWQKLQGKWHEQTRNGSMQAVVPWGEIEKLLNEYLSDQWVVYSHESSGMACGPVSVTTLIVVTKDTVVRECVVDHDLDEDQRDDKSRRLLNRNEVLATNEKLVVDNDLCIYCDRCLKVKPVEACIVKVSALTRDASGFVTGYVQSTGKLDYNWLYIDPEKCISCGRCVEVCPIECIYVDKIDPGDPALDKFMTRTQAERHNPPLTLPTQPAAVDETSQS